MDNRSQKLPELRVLLLQTIPRRAKTRLVFAFPGSPSSSPEKDEPFLEETIRSNFTATYILLKILMTGVDVVYTPMSCKLCYGSTYGSTMNVDCKYILFSIRPNISVCNLCYVPQYSKSSKERVSFSCISDTTK